MPPEDRFVCRFAAEPSQEPLASGRWAETLQAEFLGAALRIDTEGTELGDPGELKWFPDRSWAGRTFVPVTSRTENGLDLFGYVSYVPGESGDQPSDFYSWADFTDETSERNPDWQMDLCEEVIGGWRGEHGEVAAMTLVWGVADGPRRRDRHRRARRPDRRPVHPHERPLHADRPRRLPRRLPGDRALGDVRQRAGTRVALRRRRQRVAVR